MLTSLVIIIHVLVCMALILIILLQATKGAGMGAAFGGASQTLFGSTGRATFLTKITIVAAVVFCLTAVGLSMMSTKTVSVMDDFTPEEPAVPKLPELPPIPEAPMGAESKLPGIVPGEAGPGVGEPAGAPSPGEGRPSLVPPLPEGPIAPPETGSPTRSRSEPAGSGESPETEEAPETSEQ